MSDPAVSKTGTAFAASSENKTRRVRKGETNTMEITEMTDRFDCIRLENQLCFPLYACAKEIVRRYREPLGALSLTYTQYIVMMALWEHDSLTEGELDAKIYLDSGTLTPVLKRLEKQGYLSRRRSETDERRLMLTLTEEGKALRSPLFTALREGGLLEDDHAGGCVLYEKRAQVERLLAEAGQKGA